MFRFRLPRRNYDHLRQTTIVPRILVVLHMPEDEATWISVTAEQLAMRRCAYWASLVGFPESENVDSVTVSIDKDNRFDVGAARALMNLARREGAAE